MNGIDKAAVAGIGIAAIMVLLCAMPAAVSADRERLNSLYATAPSGTNVWYSETITGIGYGQADIQIPAWKGYSGTAIYFQRAGNIVRSIVIAIDTRAGSFFVEQNCIYPPAFGNIGNFGQLPRETVSISP